MFMEKFSDGPMLLLSVVNKCHLNVVEICVNETIVMSGLLYIFSPGAQFSKDKIMLTLS